ncbi:MAG: DNA polymerase III subunit gamma/tau [Alphaproteobacteria bacterium]
MSKKDSQPYRVLARKYRPQNFDELIGQDTLVRTLKNAIESGRIAHAFMLTGVRGVGKTTTARIIAKALNYTGPDGQAGPTTSSTDDCALCAAIAEDRHPDVIEMDAASRTGIDDIREILDGVRYAPTEARYKIYIIDEVHMLSKQAFNALLKTLEEPPEHVKFIFATTEIRKVPITVLSRCQRFDLRRVDIPTLVKHFTNICAQENAKADEEALTLIARAADGSVRDGLSLLDRAIALGGPEDAITATHIESMLGLADRARSMDLLERALTGCMKEALDIMDELYASGCDPLVLAQDLLGLTHILMRLRAAPDSAQDRNAMTADETARATALAQSLSMPTLGKTWQILLKGLGEIQTAPNPQSAAEIVLIRLTYAADLPDPADLLRRLDQSGNTQDVGSASSAPVASSSASSAPVSSTAPVSQTSASRSGASYTPTPTTALATKPITQPHNTEPETALHTFEDIVTFLESRDEWLLASQLFQFAHPVKIESLDIGGRLEIRQADHAPQKMAQDLGTKLSAITGQRWIVSVSEKAGEPTLAEKAQAAREADLANILQMPVMRDIMAVFPDAEIIEITQAPGNTNKGA